MFELAFDQFWSRWNNNSGKHCQKATRMNNFLTIFVTLTVVYGFGVLGQFLEQKNKQEKLIEFIKTF